VVGFAAESQELIDNARAKLATKNLDMIVANDVTAPDAGFATETNRVVILDRTGGMEELPLMSKAAVAEAILDRVASLLTKERS
jgi:phosphopantothenoylcysteine decarboxylase/phosphopantothenate--cysteine ligase